MNVYDLVIQSGLVGRLVVGLLLFLSVMSWAIILYKLWLFKQAGSENETFLKYFHKRGLGISEIRAAAARYEQSPLAVTFVDGMERLPMYLNISPEDFNMRLREGSFDRQHLKSFEKGLKLASREEISHLESYLIFLATTSSVSPLLGLFGTVWGVMHAFYEIGMNASAGMASVGPGVAEALVTTVAGLVAAIPALVFYNVFKSKVRKISGQINSFCNEVMERVENSLKTPQHRDAYKIQ